MKIMKFDEFAAMPAGTIYSEYLPAICQGLYRKGDTCVWDGYAKDFFTASLIAESGCHQNEPLIVDPTESRWGLFDYDQLFAVYEESDLVAMWSMLLAPKEFEMLQVTPKGQ